MTADAIATLPDGQAIATLQLVLERQGYAADAAELRASQAHLVEALGQPDAHDLAEADPSATEGALARTALAHLAADPGARELVERAITITASDPDRSQERFEPITLAVGALVLLAFRTDLSLQHDPGKGWTFKLRTKPLSDSAVGKILSQLFGAYLGH